MEKVYALYIIKCFLLYKFFALKFFIYFSFKRKFYVFKRTNSLIKKYNSLILKTQKLYKKIFCAVRTENLLIEAIQKLGFIEELFLLIIFKRTMSDG